MPAPAGPAAAVGSYTVRSGDNLSGIAGRHRPSGVMLEQMVVAVYRANPQAFEGENMNRLKSGAVLSLPAAADAQSIGVAEARQIIQAQSADFSAYRQRLASEARTLPDGGNARSAQGKLQASVTEAKPAASSSPDKLKLSQGSAGSPASQQVDKLSKDQEKKAADQRLAELSRNVEELKRLSQNTKPAAPATPVPAPAPAKPTPAAPAPAPAPAPVLSPRGAAVAASAPVAGAPVAATAAKPAAAASAPKPAAAKPVATASAASSALPVDDLPEEDSGLGSMWTALLGLVGLAGAGAGGFLYWKRRKPRQYGETSFLESKLPQDSFFGASGGQRVDTRDAESAASSMSYSLSQLDAIGDVDPVAEADVYLAYGRDLQAEEILKEALRSNPSRLAIHTKLLEVYAKRRDAKGFESLATTLHGLTEGKGEDWARAREMGVQLDPENPMYQGGGDDLSAVPDEQAEGEALGLRDSELPASLYEVEHEDAQQTAPAMAVLDAMDLASALPSEASEPAVQENLDLDLDLGGEPSPAPSEPAEPPPAAFDQGGLDFDLDADAMPPVPSADTSPAAFDLGSISLDLDDGSGNQEPDTLSPELAEAAGLQLDEEVLDEDGSNPLQRKLDLAEEFRQIGDLEGARDLLNEVISKSEGGLRAKAQNMLDNLA
jgi:pilus assembly protein FimV